MRRIVPILIFLFCLTFMFVSPAVSAWWGDDTLVTIDEIQYTTEDFKRWWHFWNDTEMTLPDKPDFYVDWLLLAREGERMRLAEDPAFQRRTEVFLKVRSLLMLQKEEVFDKVDVSDEELRARYEKLYTPIWLLARLSFDDESTAQTAYKELMNSSITLEELVARSPEEGGPSSYREDWRRPIGIDETWADMFKELEVGEATEPIKDTEPITNIDSYIFYYLKTKENGTPTDFEKLRGRLHDKITGEKEQELLADLMSRLYEKFEVEVDYDRLAELPLDAPDDAYGDEPVITTNRLNVSEKEFIAILRRDQAVRQQPHSKKTDEEEIKNRVANGIISQNLTDWEALDRHYEEKEPLKWDYLFNRRHRLTVEVQDRLFVSGADASEEEIKEYYTENIGHYTQPEIVNLVLIQDLNGSVDLIWSEVATGKDFFQTVRENTDQDTTVQAIPTLHLDPSIQKVVEGLGKKETSQPFVSQGQRFLVYLADRTPADILPLEEVTENVRATIIKEKIAKQRQEYLNLLKSRSEIKVNQSNWQALKKELGGN